MAKFTLFYSEQSNSAPLQSGWNSFNVAFEGSHTFTVADLTADTNPEYVGNAFYSTKIVTIPSKGTFQLNGVDVVAGDEILASDIDLGLFIYNAESYDNGYTDSSAQFLVADELSLSYNSRSNKLVFIVSSNENAPPDQVGAITISLTNPETHTFTPKEFTTHTVPAYSDPEGDDAYAVKITSIPFYGTLYYNNVELSLNDSILIEDIDSGFFTYVTDDTQESDTSETITFSVSDKGSYEFTSGGVVTMNVEAYVGSEPRINEETNVYVELNTDYTFTRYDLVTAAGYSDADGDTAEAIRFTSLPSSGELQLDGVAVSVAQEISLDDVDSGLLIYYTVDDTLGEFEMEYQVKDSSGEWSSTDISALAITSGSVGISLNENSGTGQVVYTIIAEDNTGIVNYEINGDDAQLLTLTGNVVTLNVNPNFETKSIYSFNAIASDEAGNVTTKTITFSILDVDEVTPIITSPNFGLDLNDSSGAGQTIYTITATDNVGIVSYAIGGADASLLSVDSSNGVVTLIADPDHNTKSNYSFNVTATDASGNVTDAKTVTFQVYLGSDTESPVIISGSFGTNLVENTGANQLVYTIIATDNVGVVNYELVGQDASLLSIDDNEVRLIADPDFETKSSYSFGVTATDLRLNTSSVKNVTFEVSDVVYESLPFIFTVDSSFTSFDNSSGPFQFTMPMENSDATYNLVIDDGETTIENLSGPYVITFAKRGFNTVKVFSDSLTGWSTASITDTRKIRGISQFGTFASDSRPFRNCYNLEYITATDCDYFNSITDAPYLFGSNTSLQYLPSTLTLDAATNGNQAFIQNYELTTLPDGMTLNNLSNGFRMFRQSGLVDLPEGMKLSSLTNGNQMFLACTINTERYSQLLIDMESTNSNSNVTFGGGESKYNAAGKVARDLLIARGWVILDGGLEGGSSYLLDTYTNSVVAYSLSRLSFNITNVIRVRRDSDDTEQDFSADEVADGTLTTFVGSGDGFVTTMYDQSGNGNDGVQNTNSKQPRIVENGVYLEYVDFSSGSLEPSSQVDSFGVNSKMNFVDVVNVNYNSNAFKTLHKWGNSIFRSYPSGGRMYVPGVSNQSWNGIQDGVWGLINYSTNLGGTEDDGIAQTIVSRFNGSSLTKDFSDNRDHWDASYRDFSGIGDSSSSGSTAEVHRKAFIIFNDDISDFNSLETDVNELFNIY